MFNAWKQEKTTAALVDEAQAIADKLGSAKPHVLDSFAATAEFWAATYLAEGQDLYALLDLPPAKAARFATSVATKIAALRKAREYDSSDGLSVWLHTARAVSEPRILPAVTDIWRLLTKAGPNASSMAEDLLQDAGLPFVGLGRTPKGISTADPSTGSD